MPTVRLMVTCVRSRPRGRNASGSGRGEKLTLHQQLRQRRQGEISRRTIRHRRRTADVLSYGEPRQPEISAAHRGNSRTIPRMHTGT